MRLSPTDSGRPILDAPILRALVGPIHTWTTRGTLVTEGSVTVSSVSGAPALNVCAILRGRDRDGRTENLDRVFSEQVPVVDADPTHIDLDLTRFIVPVGERQRFTNDEVEVEIRAQSRLGATVQQFYLSGARMRRLTKLLASSSGRSSAL